VCSAVAWNSPSSSCVFVRSGFHSALRLRSYTLEFPERKSDEWSARMLHVLSLIDDDFLPSFGCMHFETAAPWEMIPARALSFRETWPQFRINPDSHCFSSKRLVPWGMPSDMMLGCPYLRNCAVDIGRRKQIACSGPFPCPLHV
jgi:hypothetical protein